MDILTRQFGLIIAYLLPGFIALAGLAPLVPAVAAWWRIGQSASLGAPVYILLAATTAGMIVGCFRWLIIDQILKLTGLAGPSFNGEALRAAPDAFNYLVESHYRYYQFYSGTLIALIWTYGVYRILGTTSFLGHGTDAAMVIICVVLLLGARDALTKYRSRSSLLTGFQAVLHFDGDGMTNGIDHNQGNDAHTTKTPTDRQKPKSQPVPQPSDRSKGDGRNKK